MDLNASTGTHQAENTIFEAVSQCVKQIKVYITSDRPLSRRYATSMQGKLEVWAKYSGAISRQGLSLDDRLEVLPGVKHAVLALLLVITMQIKQALSLPDQEIDTRVGEGQIVEDMDDNDQTLSPQASNRQRIVGQRLGSQSAPWTAISRAIDSLFKVAGAIRESGNASDDTEIPAHYSRPDDSYFEEMIKLLVRRWFPHVRRDLSDQLGRGVYIRRRKILYRQRHEEKLQFERSSASLDQTGPEMTTLPGQLSNLLSESTNQQTGPSTADATKRQLVAPSLTQFSQFGTQSAIIRRAKAATVVTGRIHGSLVSESTELEYPEKPTTSDINLPVFCPYCSKQLTQSQLRNWRRHVDEDLKPLICLSELCQNPPQLFALQSDWLKHMDKHHGNNWPQTIHMTTWFCDLNHDEQQEFVSIDSFRQHLTTHILTNPEQDVLIRHNQAIGSRAFGVCPLCEDSPQQKPNLGVQGLFDHIANHLRRIALMALPAVDVRPSSNGDAVGSLQSDKVIMPDSLSSLQDFLSRSDSINTGLMGDINSNQQPLMMQKRRDKNGRTRIARACAVNDFKAVYENLRDHPEEIDEADNAGNTPLQIASLEGYVGIVDLLLKRGCKVNTENCDKDTPLIDSVENSHLMVVTLLLEAGANPRTHNAKGQEPIDLVDLEHGDGQAIKEVIIKHTLMYNSKRRQKAREAPDTGKDSLSNRSPLSDMASAALSETRYEIPKKIHETEMGRGGDNVTTDHPRAATHQSIPRSHQVSTHDVVISNSTIDKEASFTIKCICNYSHDDGFTISCESCNTRQHVDCYYEPENIPGDDDIHNCVDCDPRVLDQGRAIGIQRAKSAHIDAVESHHSVEDDLERGSWNNVTRADEYQPISKQAWLTTGDIKVRVRIKAVDPKSGKETWIDKGDGFCDVHKDMRPIAVFSFGESSILLTELKRSKTYRRDQDTIIETTANSDMLAVIKFYDQTQCEHIWDLFIDYLNSPVGEKQASTSDAENSVEAQVSGQAKTSNTTPVTASNLEPTTDPLNEKIRWLRRVFSQSRPTTAFDVTSSESALLGKDMPRLTEQLREGNYMEEMRLHFDNYIEVKIFVRERDHKAHIYCKYESNGSVIASCRPVSKLHIRRQDSNLQLYEFDEEKRARMWLILRFSSYEQMVLFFCAFLSLERRGSVNDHIMSEEQHVFSCSIYYNHVRLALQIFKDTCSRGIRLQASVLRGEMKTAPVWTAFINYKVASFNWIRRVAHRKIHFNDLVRYIFFPDYHTETELHGENEIISDESKDEDTFEIIFDEPKDADKFGEVIEDLAKGRI